MEDVDMANSGLSRAGLPETGAPRRSASRQGSKTTAGRKRTQSERADLDGEHVVVAWVDTASPHPTTVPFKRTPATPAWPDFGTAAS